MRSSRGLIVCGLLAAAGWLIGLAPPASAGTVVQYNFNENLAAWTAPGLKASNISKGTGLDAFERFQKGTAGGYGTNHVLRVVPTTSSATNAGTSTSYFEFTVAVDDGYTLDLEKLTLDVAKGGDKFERGFVVRSSADDFETNIPGTPQIVTSVRPTLTTFTVDLSKGSTFKNLTESLTFRIYSYSTGTVSSGASLEYDNITLHGFVAAPEPGTLALALSGLVVLPAAAWRRYRRGEMAGRSAQ